MMLWDSRKPPCNQTHAKILNFIFSFSPVFVRQRRGSGTFDAHYHDASESKLADQKAEAKVEETKLDTRKIAMRQRAEDPALRALLAHSSRRVTISSRVVPMTSSPCHIPA